MTLLEFRDEVKNRMFDTDDAIASDAQVNGWVNLAIRKVASRWDWSFLKVRIEEDTVVGEDLIEVATDVRRINKVMIIDTSNFGQLNAMPDRWIQNNFEDRSTTGKPLYYTHAPYLQAAQTSAPIYQIRIAPKADAVYTLEITYTQTPPKLTADGHYPLLPVEFDEAIISYVMIQYAKQIEDTVLAQQYEREFEDEVKFLIYNFATWTGEKYPKLQEDETQDWSWRIGGV